MKTSRHARPKRSGATSRPTPNCSRRWRQTCRTRACRPRIRIGAHGYAMVLASDGELVAHGDPDKKALVAQSRNLSAHPLVAALRAARASHPVSSEYTDDGGQTQLGVAAAMAPLGWTMIVE